MYHDCVYVVLISLASALLAEGITWVLIYRTESYQKLKKGVESLQKKLERKKDKAASVASVHENRKSKDKKVATLDEQLKSRSKAMDMAKFKSMFFVAFTLVGIFALMNNMFEGRPVAKLPFVPLPILRFLSHRGLGGADFTDCSMVFIYTICSFSIKQTITRFFGFAPKKNTGGMFSGFGAPAN